MAINFTFRSQRYSFSPSWLLTTITVLLFCILVSLGKWQLHRAEEKRTLLRAFVSRMHEPPQPLTAVPQNTQDWLYRPLKARGHFDNTHLILLDNKFHEHHIGYQVLAPLVIPGQTQQLLVNLGWVPTNAHNRQLPYILPITGEQTVVGTLYLPQTHPFRLGPILDPEDTWPVRAQVAHLATFQTKLNKPLYPFILLLSPTAKYGFIRDWQPVTSPPERNIGYALQWFSFAGILLVVFFFVATHKIIP